MEELYEDAPVGFVTTTPDGTIVRANRTFLAWAGYEADDLVGRRRLYDLLPPGAKIYYETHYAPLLQMHGRVRELALEVVRSDGTRLPVLVNAIAKPDAEGRPALVRVTLFDASERRRYERELLHARTAAEERAAAATALMHVAEAVVLVDPDGVVRVLNPAAERLLGCAAEELVGLRLSAVVPGWDALAERIPRGAAGDPASAVVLPLAMRAGTRWVVAASEPAGENLVYTLRDVTEERRLEEMRDDIVAVVSHELRTPLAGVLGAAQTLVASGDALDAETQRALVEMMAAQSARLTRILDAMLLAERLDAGGVEVRSGAFDAAAVAAEAAGDGVVLEADGDTRAEGDPALYGQVVAHLVDNARRYGPERGEIRLRAERRHGSVRLTVSDEGPGIAPGDRERIFERFLRLDPAHSAGAGGTGLGLHIARELVRRMRGRIGVLDSERGATFYVDLPAAP